MSHDWRGEEQRRSLSGFARLRAIIWPRSLALAEWFTLGGNPWFRRLRWQLWKARRGLDLHSRSRVQGESDIYGGTPTLTVVKLLELLSRLRPEHPRSFLDLGSGIGTPSLTAASLGYSAQGMERESLWVERANSVAEQLGLDCQFLEADFLASPWPSPTVVFTVGTAYPPELREELLGRFLALAPGSVVLTGDWDLAGTEQQLPLLWEGKLPVEWGIIWFRIYGVGAPGASAVSKS